MKALAFAVEKHGDKKRKASGEPYGVHLKGAANVLLHLGLCAPKFEDLLCAAYLHDTIEDTDTTYKELSDEFGTRVAQLVSSVSEDKSLPRESRKLAYLNNISELDDMEVLFLSWADKAEQMEDLAEEIRKQGPEVLNVFGGGAQTITAFYDVFFRRFYHKILRPLYEQESGLGVRLRSVTNTLQNLELIKAAAQELREGGAK